MPDTHETPAEDATDTESTAVTDRATDDTGRSHSRRSVLVAAGAIGVLGPAAALTMGRPGTSEPTVRVGSPDCRRIRVTNTGGDAVRIHIEGPNAVRVPDEGGIILAPAEQYVLNVAAVDGVRGTYTVYDDDTDAVLASHDHVTCVTYYQVQFAVGEPKPALGRDEEDFYASEGRLLRFVNGSSEDGVTRGGRPGDSAVPEAVEANLTMEHGIQVEGDEAFVRFTVAAGHEYQLSLTSTLTPDESFDWDERQALYDDDTGTFGPGTHELRVRLPFSHDEIRSA
jgi:hypothetical protein